MAGSAPELTAISGLRHICWLHVSRGNGEILREACIYCSLCACACVQTFVHMHGHKSLAYIDSSMLKPEQRVNFDLV